jgi:hypothetical protein
VRKTIIRTGLIAALGVAAGCSSGQSSAEPGTTSVNVTNFKAQLAVGVATFVDGSTGLNVVATFRQPDGLSGTLLNTPTIVGPAAFRVPAGMGGVDGGTNHISASPQVPPLATPTSTTLGTTGGVFAYGLAPDNSDTTGSSYNFVYDGAFYDATGALMGADSGGNPIEFRGGPPAYPNVLDGTYPSGFGGFTEGFTEFDAPPVAGTYTLSIVVPAANAASTTIAATPGAIANVAGSLGPIAAAPAFVEDGNGGGTATCAVPLNAKETLVDITDVTADAFFTAVVKGGGAIAATFAPNIGAYSGGVAGPTLTSGDEYSVSCIATNYPAFEAGPPGNLQQLPTIVGANGQADISFSPNLDATYGGASANARKRAAKKVRNTFNAAK